MNQLIEKFIAESTICQGHPQIDGSYFDTEKFAELIVRECVRYFNEDYQRDFDTLWREDLSKGIKEHFGVER
jgi:hypothetical protein